MSAENSAKIRKFATGATRDVETEKLDYEGFLSPIVLKTYAEYMHKHRIQPDGQIRESDNWQKGIPKESYMKSGWRHFMDWWLEHRGYESRAGIKDALCGVIFNAMGYLFELLKQEKVPGELVKRQLIKSRRRQGKAFESMISHAFRRLKKQEKRFWFMRIYDYQAFIRLNPKLCAPKQPADYLACANGKLYFVECKSSQANRFPIKVFKPHQEQAMQETATVGGVYWLLILHRQKKKKDQVIYAFDWESWQKLKNRQEMKRVDWNTIKTYATMTFTRENGAWNLRRLFFA